MKQNDIVLPYKRRSCRNSKKNSLNVRDNSTKLYDIDISSISNVLVKTQLDRSTADILLISKVLERTDIILLFKKESITDEIGINNLLISLSYTLEYEYKPENSIVFNINDEGGKFYVIIKGKVDVMKPIKREYNLTSLEYFTELIKLKESSQLVLLNKTIKENKNIFPLKSSDLDKIEMVLNKFKIKRKLNLLLKVAEKGYNLNDYKNTFIEIKELISTDSKKYNYKYDFKEDDYNSNITKVNAFYINFTNDNNELFEQYNVLDIDNERHNQDENKHKLIIYDYESVITLKDNQCFGDSALVDKSRKRNATIITLTECHFAVINQRIYNEIMGLERHKIVFKQINYLNELAIFQSLKRTTFDRKYFSLFVLNEYQRNDILCREGDEVRYIYILKEGSVEIKLEKSIIELKKIIIGLKCLEDTLPSVNVEFPKTQNLLENYKKKRNFLIYNYVNKDCIGAEEFSYKITHLTNAIVVSNKALIYSIDIKWIYAMFNSELGVVEDFKNFSLHKISILYNRLLDLDKNISSVTQEEHKNNSLSNNLINFNAEGVYTIKKNLDNLQNSEKDYKVFRTRRFKSMDQDLPKILEKSNKKSSSICSVSKSNNLNYSNKKSCNKNTTSYYFNNFNKSILIEEIKLKTITNRLNDSMLFIDEYSKPKDTVISNKLFSSLNYNSFRNSLKNFLSVNNKV